MSEILRAFSLSTIGLSIDANKIAHEAFISTYPGGAFHQDAGICWYETGVPLYIFNGVGQSLVEPARLPTAIARIQAHFRQRSLPFHWTIGPSSQPTNIGSILEAHGLEYEEDEPGMAVDLDALNTDLPLSSALTILPVINQELLRQWTRVWGVGYEEIADQCFNAFSALDLGPESPFQLYLGLLDTIPVATTTLFYAAGVAAIGRVVTLPHVRGQGVGTTMTLAAAQQARRQGYRVGVLTASPMGFTIYRRLGFRECCTFSYYHSKGARG
jgi:GNAT superfamily N-acetyltransferase